MQIRLTLEEVEQAIEDGIGFCLTCGEPRDCCEPDAHKYECDECGAQAVYGTEELLLMGKILLK